MGADAHGAAFALAHAVDQVGDVGGGRDDVVVAAQRRDFAVFRRFEEVSSWEVEGEALHDAEEWWEDAEEERLHEGAPAEDDEDTEEDTQGGFDEPELGE